jgi:hypothetical protein
MLWKCTYVETGLHKSLQNELLLNLVKERYLGRKGVFSIQSPLRLKGHGNEADFLGFLQKLGPHRSLTVPFEPFRFWLRIRGDIRNRKTTPRLGESGSRWLSNSACRGVDDSPTRRVGESAFECLKEKLGESESRRLPDSANRGAANSPTRRVGESSTPRRHGESGSRYSNFLKFSIDFPDFKRLNQPFKRSIWQKRSQECNVLTPLIYLKVGKKLYL